MEKKKCAQHYSECVSNRINNEFNEWNGGKKKKRQLKKDSKWYHRNFNIFLEGIMQSNVNCYRCDYAGMECFSYNLLCFCLFCLIFFQSNVIVDCCNEPVNVFILYVFQCIHTQFLRIYVYCHRSFFSLLFLDERCKFWIHVTSAYTRFSFNLWSSAWNAATVAA